MYLLVYSCLFVLLRLLCTENYEFSVVLHYDNQTPKATALAGIAEMSCVTRVLLMIVLRPMLLMIVLRPMLLMEHLTGYWQHVYFTTTRFRFGPPPYDALGKTDDVLLLPRNAVYDSILCVL